MVREGAFNEWFCHRNSTSMDFFLQCILSLHNFAHAMTAQLSYNVENSITITALQLKWEQDSIEFELWWKNRSWNAPLDDRRRVLYSVFITEEGHCWSTEGISWMRALCDVPDLVEWGHCQPRHVLCPTCQHKAETFMSDNTQIYSVCAQNHDISYIAIAFGSLHVLTHWDRV